MIKAAKLVFSILLCLLAGWIGSIFTTPSIQSWYITLQKPFFTPPSWLFAPVWTALYILMGTALYLVWNAKKKKSDAMKLFGLQLLLNICWSVIFFGLKSPLFAVIEIVMLWIILLATIMKFSKISRNAALLLVPYIAWVSFAAVLNFAIFVMNY